MNKIIENALSFVAEARVVALYYPIRQEIDISGVWEYAWSKNITTLLPRIITSGEMVFCPFNSVEELSLNQYNILEPTTEAFVDKIDVAFVPGLAFDKTGIRLGYGAGYYDRYFHSNKVSQKLGVCHEDIFVDNLPRDMHDIPMDAIITEKKVYYIK